MVVPTSISRGLRRLGSKSIELLYGSWVLVGDSLCNFEDWLKVKTGMAVDVEDFVFEGIESSSESGV